ncbi:vacuolar (h+)-atpase g subunit protein [Toxoplasma gondii TgCatPRC2]|uniref:Vacuolar (H+)-atpase g subunit protein n=13 Tax=Toxoplasma gondii TaxID=5811 RepID=S7UWY3_TOXGG|nr:vacuolar (h+)-atpase g subunit protein [Toxoplasma gondii ME49]EPR62336.1 vacuolar (h+)-atpase g subunit protein [Toxoplasma gondii GT1]KAF4640829.1 vacuolar (h+)-atpase g subunit protein [Toxoplasma gondii]KFG42116.1 vacuolar (h+)-atpase g subunit protein [Toxoplasma gondii p89]KFG44983.1 vacuolar (h+)-atpase g subunit protein [Toxoplasma gondii GAB2-2007-GAL-DOM2]KFG52137.1 vacuolar (h+)-atpase g subunit protein [Toxoplasma gondii FOU]KFH10179.1 vacuolar (h+)-atpase g subunit protein [To|eukprot:XP_002366442.1 vacuolar (h+)-atpase g subunit protein [Toxoplasma gondii ME49]
MLKRLSKASRSGSGTARAAAWEEAGSTNPNTPVVEDPGGVRGVGSRGGSGEPPGTPRHGPEDEPKKRHSRASSKLFSRITSKVSRSVSALLHGDSGPSEGFDDAHGKADRARAPAQRRETEERSSASASAEAGDALNHEQSLPHKKKFHLPHPHLPGHSRMTMRPQNSQGTGALELLEGDGAAAGLAHKMHPSHLPHLHLRGSILGLVREAAHGGKDIPHCEPEPEQGVELLQQLHQAHERARQIVEKSRKQKESLLQRARAEVEQEANKLREEAEKEFEVSAEAEHEEDAAFLTATNNAKAEVDVAPEVMDHAVHFCIDQVLSVDVKLPEELKKRLPIIKAHPPTFFRKSCASQFPTTRGANEPAILKAALDHSYRQSFNQSTAHYGSFVGQDNDGYRGPGLSNLGGRSGSTDAKKEVYSAILGDRAWNDEDEFHIDLSDTEQPRAGGNWWQAGRRRGNEGENCFHRGHRALCQGCWPAVSS